MKRLIAAIALLASPALADDPMRFCISEDRETCRQELAEQIAELDESVRAQREFLGWAAMFYDQDPAAFKKAMKASRFCRRYEADPLAVGACLDGYRFGWDQD